MTPVVRNTNTAAVKQQAALTFVMGACWVTLALFTVRTVKSFLPVTIDGVLVAVLTAALVFCGLCWIGRRMVQSVRPLSSIGLVARGTQWSEFASGAALGWGISIALVLPALLTRHMQSTLSIDRFHLQQAASGLLLLLANAVTTQLVFTGLLFRSLARATSETAAALLFCCLAGSIVFLAHTGDIWQAIFAALAQLIFSMAALRTRAIWVPLGIQFAWGAALLLLFGISSFYWPAVNGPVQSYLTGPTALTGGYLGPEGSAWAVVVVPVALAVLWRITRDYAWYYTFDPIEGAGYAMEVAPPKEHRRMEAETAKQSNLVQIAPLGRPSSQSETDM